MLRRREKRKFPRLNVYHLVKYRLASWPPDKGRVLAFIRNIGAGGMQLVTNEPLLLHNVLEVQINFPRLPQPIFCKAKAVAVNKISKTNKFKISLQFIEIDELCRKNIAESAECINKIVKGKS